MQDSADVRKANMIKIRKTMWKGGLWTKQSIAATTGLSVATCNTLLNELERSGEVIGSKKRFNDVGPSTTVYQINEEFENILCIWFDMTLGEKVLHCAVMSMCGNILYTSNKTYRKLDASKIIKSAAYAFDKFPKISSVIIGVPGITERGVIRHCDIEEFESEPLLQKLKELYNVPVYMENDMYFKIYGYYKLYCGDNDVVTLLNYPSHVLPGTATVHKGTVITGKNGFAGMIGFLPFEFDRESQLEILSEKTCVPLISNAAASLIAILNPNRMIFTGDLICPLVIKAVKEECARFIPNEYMPAFEIVEDMTNVYTEGMFRFVIDRRTAFNNDEEEISL